MPYLPHSYILDWYLILRPILLCIDVHVVKGSRPMSKLHSFKQERLFEGTRYPYLLHIFLFVIGRMFRVKTRESSRHRNSWSSSRSLKGYRITYKQMTGQYSVLQLKRVVFTLFCYLGRDRENKTSKLLEDRNCATALAGIPFSFLFCETQ